MQAEPQLPLIIRYSSDTLLIPFCNVGLQKGIRRVSEELLMIGFGWYAVPAKIHGNGSNIKEFLEPWNSVPKFWSVCSIKKNAALEQKIS